MNHPPGDVQTDYVEHRSSAIRLLNPKTTTESQVAKGLDQVVEAPNTSIFEAFATGELLHVEPQNESGGGDQDMMTETLRRLQAMRRMKASLRAPETAPELAERLAQNLDDLENQVQNLVAGRENTINLCLNSQTLSESEKHRLRTLAVSEEKDLLLLDGVEIGDQLKRLQQQLSDITDGASFKSLMQLVARDPEASDLNNTRREALLGELKRLAEQPASSEMKDKAEMNLVELYIPSGPSSAVTELLVAYTKLEERLDKLESIVGLHGVASLCFPFPDMSSALIQITERVLLLDNKRIEAISERATELTKELDRIAAMKAKLGEGGMGAAAEYKIEALFHLADKWKHTAHMIPKIVNKLKYLSLLAKESSDLSHRLSSLENDVCDLKSLMEAAEAGLQMLNSRVDEQIALSHKLASLL